MSFWSEIFYSSFYMQGTQQMRKTDNTGAMMAEAAKAKSPITGEIWYIYGKPYVVSATNQKYFETNGDPEKLYLSVLSTDCTQYIITHDAFEKKAKSKPELPVVYITPDEILAANPCDEGIFALAQALSGIPHATKYAALKYLLQSIRIYRKYTVNELCKLLPLGTVVPTSWLQFIAHTKGLIPSKTSCQDLRTLKRLLGIE